MQEKKPWPYPGLVKLESALALGAILRNQQQLLALFYEHVNGCKAERDDREEPAMPGELVGQAADPVTGEPLTDPVKILAVTEGAFTVFDQAGGKAWRILWKKLMAPRRRFWRIPKYFGFTQKELETYRKLENEAFITIQHVEGIFGLDHDRNHPDKEKRRWVYKWLLDHEVPIYIGLLGRDRIFTGDLVRAVESHRAPTQEVDGLLWARFLGGQRPQSVGRFTSTKAGGANLKGGTRAPAGRGRGKGDKNNRRRSPGRGQPPTPNRPGT